MRLWQLTLAIVALLVALVVAARALLPAPASPSVWSACASPLPDELIRDTCEFGPLRSTTP